MHWYKAFFVFAVASSSTLPAQLRPFRFGARHQLAVAVVRDTTAFDGIAGCSLWLHSEPEYSVKRYVFLSDDDGHAVMNINGRDIKLNLVRMYEPKRLLRKGTRSTYRYSAPGINVLLNYVVTGACAPDDESCEVIPYDAAITITATSSKQNLRAHGICGS